MYVDYLYLDLGSLGDIRCPTIECAMLPVIESFCHEYCQGRDIRKVYRTYLTPCEKLLQIPGVEQYLRSGVTIDSLKAELIKETHLASAQKLQKAKQQLFEKISRGMVQ